MTKNFCLYQRTSFLYDLEYFRGDEKGKGDYSNYSS